MSGPAAFRHDPFTVYRLAARGPGMPGPYVATKQKGADNQEVIL